MTSTIDVNSLRDLALDYRNREGLSQEAMAVKVANMGSIRRHYIMFERKNELPTNKFDQTNFQNALESILNPNHTKTTKTGRISTKERTDLPTISKGQFHKGTPIPEEQLIGIGGTINAKRVDSPPGGIPSKTNVTEKYPPKQKVEKLREPIIMNTVRISPGYLIIWPEDSKEPLVYKINKPQ